MIWSLCEGIGYFYRMCWFLLLTSLEPKHPPGKQRVLFEIGEIEVFAFCANKSCLQIKNYPWELFKRKKKLGQTDFFLYMRKLLWPLFIFRHCLSSCPPLLNTITCQNNSRYFLSFFLIRNIASNQFFGLSVSHCLLWDSLLFQRGAISVTR